MTLVSVKTDDPFECRSGTFTRMFTTLEKTEFVYPKFRLDFSFLARKHKNTLRLGAEVGHCFSDEL